MKRIYGAVFLLLGMVLLILASALYVQVFTGSALQILDEANAAYANAEYQALPQTCILNRSPCDARAY